MIRSNVDCQASQNAFTYQIKLAPIEVKEYWESLKGKPADKKDFKAMVADFGKSVSWIDVVARLRSTNKVSNENADRNSQCWTPYTAFAALHGSEQVDAMVESGTVHWAINPALAGTSIPFPKNALFWNKKTVFAQTHKHTDEVEIQKAQGADAATTAAVEATMRSSMGVPPPVTGAPPMPPPPTYSAGTPVSALPSTPQSAPPTPLGGAPNPKPVLPPIINQVRRTHAAFDKARRDYRAVLAQSQACEMTRASPLETLLTKAIQQATSSDEVMLEVECKFNQGQPLSNDDERAAAEAVATVVDECKQSAKYVQALRFQMKLVTQPGAPKS